MKNTFRAGQKVRIVNCFGFSGMTGKVVQVLHKLVQYPDGFGRAYLVKLDENVPVLGTWENCFPTLESNLRKV